jgi:hypothetical protein
MARAALPLPSQATMMFSNRAPRVQSGGTMTIGRPDVNSIASIMVRSKETRSGKDGEIAWPCRRNEALPQVRVGFLSDKKLRANAGALRSVRNSLLGLFGTGATIGIDLIFWRLRDRKKSRTWDHTWDFENGRGQEDGKMSLLPRAKLYSVVFAGVAFLRVI